MFDEKQYCINAYIYYTKFYCSGVGADMFCEIIGYKVCIHE